jgi:RNA polymerase sigma-70 factor (ECF subfamily)
MTDSATSSIAAVWGGDCVTQFSDEQLASRVQEGCQQSFSELDRRCRARVFQMLCRRMGHRTDAEDVTQQAMWRAYDRIAQFDPRRRFTSWLFTIALNLAKDHQRAAAVRIRTAGDALPVAEVLPDHAMGAYERAVQVEQRHDLWRLVDEALPADQRTALWLHYAEGLAPREIAQAMGRTAVAVRVTLYRGRKALLPLVKDHPDFADTQPETSATMPGQSPTSSAEENQP